jgi:hypothetical protein
VDHVIQAADLRPFIIGALERLVTGATRATHAIE